MPHKPAKLLVDVIDAGTAIQSFVAGKTPDDYRTDKMFRSAVERQFEIIGEALRRLANLNPELASRISEHERIISFRNVIAHGYDVVDDAAVWQAIREKLPALMWQAKAILDELERGK